LKRRNKLIAAIIAINMVTAMGISSVSAKAEGNLETAGNLVNTAIAESNFYYYNMAYAEILKLEEGKEKEELLSKLAAISSTVWTKDISEVVQLFEGMAKEKSGRKYDALQVKIKDGAIKEIDKQYLYTELYSWGKDTVWTEDYKKAIAATIKVWSDKNYTASRAAESSIRELKLTVNKEYITELLKEAKTSVGLAPVVLTAKDFAAAANSTYVGQGKSVSVDLSEDTTDRTVILKGNYEDLYINAPKGTVILEDATVANINLLDVADHTLLMRGKTTVQTLIAEDKDHNANIVMEGTSTVASAEIRSGANVTVNTDKSVVKPFGELRLNLQEKKAEEPKEMKREIKLLGDLKESKVSVEKPLDLKVDGAVQKLQITENAKDSNVNISAKGSVQEIATKSSVKVEGAGKVDKVTVEKKVELKIEGTVAKIEISKEATDTVVSVGIAGKVAEFKAEATVKLGGAGKVDTITGTEGSKVVVTLPVVPPVNPPAPPIVIPPSTGGNDGGTTTPVEKTYSITLFRNGEAFLIPLTVADTKLSTLYETFYPLMPSSIGLRLENILVKMADIQLADAKGSLLQYTSDVLKTKAGFENLAGHLETSNTAEINKYLQANSFTTIYDAIIAATGGSVAIPDLGGSLAVTVKGTEELNYTEGSVLSLDRITSVIGINKDSKVSDLLNKNFAVEVSYAEKSYKVTANNGTIVFITNGSDEYKVVIKAN
jgi:6-pyruvoyl-tetrahydropterin synthase